MRPLLGHTGDQTRMADCPQSAKFVVGADLTNSLRQLLCGLAAKQAYLANSDTTISAPKPMAARTPEYLGPLWKASGSKVSAVMAINAPAP